MDRLPDLPSGRSDLNTLSHQAERRSHALPLTLGGVVLSVALGGLAYLIASDWSGGTAPAEHRAPAPAGCSLRRGACTAAFPGGQTLSLDIEPKSLPPMQPLRIAVEVDGFDADRIKVVFTGVSMNMGVNESRLLDVGEHSFAGEAILPICIRRSMDWEARVLASGPEGAWQASFFFETRQP